MESYWGGQVTPLRAGLITSSDEGRPSMTIHECVAVPNLLQMPTPRLATYEAAREPEPLEWFLPGPCSVKRWTSIRSLSRLAESGP
jgi:hypothetical protein